MNEVFTIVKKYEDFENCFLYNINVREFVDKYYNRDFTVYGKIVKWEGSDYKGGKVGLKITDVKKDISIYNIWSDHPFWVGLFGSLLLIIIYGLLVRYGIINHND